MTKVILITTQDFMERYLFYIHKSATNKEAWEKVEEEWKTMHGRNYYTSYESFRVGKFKYFRGKK